MEGKEHWKHQASDLETAFCVMRRQHVQELAEYAAVVPQVAPACHDLCERRITDLKSHLRVYEKSIADLKGQLKVYEKRYWARAKQRQETESSSVISSSCNSTFGLKRGKALEKVAGTQPSIPVKIDARAAPVVLFPFKEVIRSGVRGGNTVEMAIVPFTAEQIRAVGKQVGPLRNAIIWLMEMAMIENSAGNMMSDVQECMDSKDFTALPLIIRN